MIDVTVCVGASCHANGAPNVAMSFRHLIEELGLHDSVRLSESFCMNRCGQETVNVSVNGERSSVVPEEARKFFREKVAPLAGK